jgi:hypothetical protein
MGTGERIVEGDAAVLFESKIFAVDQSMARPRFTAFLEFSDDGWAYEPQEEK